jgi:hypothetical protein
MKLFLFVASFVFGALLMLLAASAQAAHLLSDPLGNNPTGQPPTHCEMTLDATAPVLVPVTPGNTVPPPDNTPAGTVVCYYDLAGIAAGPHAGKARSAWVDPTGVFATVTSPGFSNTVNFTVPGAGPAPSVLRLVK